MESSQIAHLASLSTYDLAFNLATGKYNDSEKLYVLDIIRQRGNTGGSSIKANPAPPIPIALTSKIKLPAEGSKSEKIYKLFKDGKSPSEIKALLKKQKITTYDAEIYRVKKKYNF